MGLRPSSKITQHPRKGNNEADNGSIKVIDDVEENTSDAPSSPSNDTLKREAWTARAKLLLNFHHAISHAINSPEMKRKCYEIATSMSMAEESSVNTDYDAEAALIVQNKHKRDTDVRDRALAVGFVTFVVLRGTPIMRSAVGRLVASTRKYKFEYASSSSSSQQVSHELRQPTQTVQPGGSGNSPSRLRKFLRLTMDATISAAMTILSGTFLFTPRPSAYIEDMSKLPLVEGKSVYAEVVCPPLLNEYKRTMEQFGGRWPVMTSSLSSSSGSSTLTQEDVSLNIIRTFAENCSKRIKYERALNGTIFLEDKKKLGTVSIPRPGVPDDVKVNIDEDVFFLIDDDVKEAEVCAD